MTTFFKKYQSIITVVVVIIVAFVGYSLFFGSRSDDQAALVVEEGVDTSPAEEELVQLLLKLRSITLDMSLLQHEGYMSLQDFGQVIVQEPIGRANPFAPFGAE